MKLHRILLLTLALLPCNMFGMEIQKPTKKDLLRDIVFYEYMINCHPINEIEAFEKYYPDNRYKDNGITISVQDKNFQINMDNEDTIKPSKANLIKNHHFRKFVAHKLLRLHFYYPDTPLDSTINKLRRECVDRQKACILIPTSGTTALGYNYYKNTTESFLNYNEQKSFLNNKANEPYNDKLQRELFYKRITDGTLLSAGFIAFVGFLANQSTIVFLTNQSTSC